MLGNGLKRGPRAPLVSGAGRSWRISAVISSGNALKRRGWPYGSLDFGQGRPARPSGARGGPIVEDQRRHFKRQRSETAWLALWIDGFWTRPRGPCLISGKRQIKFRSGPICCAAQTGDHRRHNNTGARGHDLFPHHTCACKSERTDESGGNRTSGCPPPCADRMRPAARQCHVRTARGRIRP